MRFPATVNVTRTVDANGLPIVKAAIEVTDIDGAQPIPGGDQGDRGEQGEPQPGFTWMGDATASQLSAMALTPADRLKCWRNSDTNAMHCWTGSVWKVSVDAHGPQGPIGPGSELTATVATNSNASAGADLTGVAPSQSLRLHLPRGPQGNVGPPEAASWIQGYPDFYHPEFPATGQVAGYDASLQKFRAVNPSGLVGPYGYSASATTWEENITDQERRVLSALVPSQQFDYRPMAYANVEVGCPDKDTRVDAAVRMGAGGPIVAYGESYPAGDRPLACVVGPDFDMSVQPHERSRVVPAGTPVFFDLTLTRIYGSDAWSYSQRKLCLYIWLQPV